MQLLLYSGIFIAQACLASAISIPGKVSDVLIKRKAETNATLYAYGANSSAWPIAAGRTDDPSTTEFDVDELLWDLPSMTGENWIANATYLNGTSAGSLYIRPGDDYALGVLPMTRVAYINGTVSGFALFATQLVYNNNSYLESQFWATSTNDSSAYKLVWNAEDEFTDGSFPVVVKGVEN
ncbi:hypothetical protein PFICI_10701 [Pestalotiopsis fici W106-1]|uniref:Uncharacterized protein n=1 Tax=Pestalotiopsis fici (strain W106-1 / CGMCC3.15140) TaxID=1229662 RepID=W3WUN4_PESFW|nr:uncharacterized protein PFICI_10701 [Pestalotiopsis fici W106-1]ETS76827.1 hypothetical protein PFICI_10701 [Pestalotiopsis fici W106-1]